MKASQCTTTSAPAIVIASVLAPVRRREKSSRSTTSQRTAVANPPWASVKDNSRDRSGTGVSELRKLMLLPSLL